MIVAAALFFATVITMAAVYPTTTDIFDANYLSALKMGDNSYQVSYYLGVPDIGEQYEEEMRDFTGDYYYFGNNYRKIYGELKEINKEYEEALENWDLATVLSLETKKDTLEKQLQNLKYKYIKVTFDHSRLTAVRYDAKCDGATKTVKTVKGITFNQNAYYLDENLCDIGVGITYTDGSYAYSRLSDVNDLSLDRTPGSQRVIWRDDWGFYTAYLTFVEKTEADDGSSFDRALTIDAGSPNRVEITEGGRKAFYKFNPTTEGKYKVSYVGNANAKIEVYRKTDTSQAIVSADNYQYTDKNFEFNIRYSANTTYYLVVWLMNPSETGSFEFSVTKMRAN